MADSVRYWRWGESVAPLRELLARGGMLAIPSESSYGLAADPRHRDGVAAVYEAKGRVPRKPLPVVAAELGQLIALGVPRSLPQLEVGMSLWPAPLSVLLPIAAPLPASAGESTLAARIPAHRRLRELLVQLGFAVTATSANRSGESPVVDPAALGPILAGREAIAIDDGVLPGGAPSTLVEWRDGQLRVLRHGAFPVAGLPREIPGLSSRVRSHNSSGAYERTGRGGSESEIDR